MPKLRVLREILERYGAVKVSRPDLTTPCEIYEIDPLKHDKSALRREIEQTGFEFANWSGADYLNGLAGTKKLVTPTFNIRDVVVGEDGPKLDDSPSADQKVLDVMLSGRTVCYESPEEMVRVQALMKPGIVAVPVDTEFILNRARERNYVRAGNAIILANPHSPGNYGLLIEKPFN